MGQAKGADPECGCRAANYAAHPRAASDSRQHQPLAAKQLRKSAVPWCGEKQTDPYRQGRQRPAAMATGSGEPIAAQSPARAAAGREEATMENADPAVHRPLARIGRAGLGSGAPERSGPRSLVSRRSPRWTTMPWRSGLDRRRYVVVENRSANWRAKPVGLVDKLASTLAMPVAMWAGAVSVYRAGDGGGGGGVACHAVSALVALSPSCR